MPINDTLVKYVADYIDYKALTLAESTIYGYRVILDKHLAPYFKSMKLQDVTVRHLQEYIVAKNPVDRLEPLSPPKAEIKFLTTLLTDSSLRFQSTPPRGG